jgi:trehalose/maltose hydrolase-like predicted phosphorylase
MQDWMLVYNYFDPAEERLREALCTLGNGYFATRGAAKETSADETHYPGTYLAGGYNRLKSKIVGRVIENEDLVNLPNWLCLSFRAEDGDWFDLRAQAGYQGAMYPWQSGSNGREESQVVHLNPISGRWITAASYLQRHVNSAIAYNIWQYYQATGDREYLSHYGAEMILEIARFWASLTTYSSDLERYEIRGVVGPDEYHDQLPGVDTPG